MINTTLVLMATLASPQPTTVTQSTPEFEPDHAEVTVHDDALEIQVFDDDDELVGVLLMTTDADGLQIDASFVDGYVEGVMPSSPAHFDPPRGMISSDQLRRLCEGDEPDGDHGGVMWWGTDLADPCAATERVTRIFALAEAGIAERDAELTIRLGDGPHRHGPTKRECIVRFAAAGTVCGFTIVFPYTVFAAVACLKGVFDTWCGCGKYLPVEVC